MSYILDAISKAEKQRQQDKVPTLESLVAESQVKKKRPNFVRWILILTLLIVLGATAWLYRPAEYPFPELTSIVMEKMDAGLQYVSEMTGVNLTGNGNQEITAKKQTANKAAGNVNDLSWLTAAQKRQLNNIQFTVISYSRDKNKRFIMNGSQVLREGDSMNGFIIAAIEPNRIVLESNGRQVAISP